MSFSAAGETIDRLQYRIAKLEELQYEWASIINRLAGIALDGAFGDSNDRDYAHDMIKMVNPYLGLAEE